MADKDYYDILGVRQNAGRDEIELAYKGRRSQYHPDRYSQSDVETLAWATSKIQAVNEAYQVLDSAELRAEFDRRRSSDGSTRSQPERQDAASAQEVNDAASVLLKPEWSWSYDKVYARPNIPYKKLGGAISSYAPEVTPEEVIVLLDDTLFGGAKEGLLVTNNAIYCKRILEKPKRMVFTDIKQVTTGPNRRVIVNGLEFFKADLIDHLAVLTFSSRLATLFMTSPRHDGDATESNNNPQSSGVDSLFTLHRAALEALRLELGDGAFLIDDLIAGQMGCIADQYSILRQAVKSKSRAQSASRSIDAESAELGLMLFLILHYYGLSRLPSDFKAWAGDEFTRFHGVSDVYKSAFRSGFPIVFRRSMEMSEEDLSMMSLLFLHRDGEGELNLDIPREESLFILLSRLGIQGATARELLRSFEDQVHSWLEDFSALMDD